MRQTLFRFYSGTQVRSDKPVQGKTREDKFSDQLLTALDKDVGEVLALLTRPDHPASDPSNWTAEGQWAPHRFQVLVRCVDSLLGPVVDSIEHKASTKGSRKVREALRSRRRSALVVFCHSLPRQPPAGLPLQGWDKVTLGDLKKFAEEAVASVWASTKKRESTKEASDARSGMSRGLCAMPRCIYMLTTRRAAGSQAARGGGVRALCDPPAAPPPG